MRKNIYKSERYGEIEGYGKPNIITVDFPIGAAVSKEGWSIFYGSPFCYNENLIHTVVALFKDLTGAKVCRWELDLHRELYDDFKTNLTMTKIPTHNTKEELVGKFTKILSRHPFIIQSMGGKVTVVIRFTVNEPLRIQGKTYETVYNYLDKVWLGDLELKNPNEFKFFYGGSYSLDKILAWDGIYIGNTEKADSRKSRLPINKE